MSLTTTRPRRAARRAALAAALALLVGWPAGLAPNGAPARASELAAEAEGPPLAAPGGGKPADDVEAAPDGQTPSIHYRHDLEHAGDAITFEPGDRVTHAFTPRPDDGWEVDGRPPRPLPAGHATGAQMRNAAPGTTWAAGVPSDVVSPAHFGEPSAAVAPEPRGAALASTTLDPSQEAGAAAPIGPSGLRREIFGFLPYWELPDSSTVLDWRTLSTIAYFSVGCTSSGGLLKTNADGSTSTGWAGWTSSKMTSVINAAHQNRTRVVLTITCFAWSNGGATTQAALLGSSTARSRLARQVAAAVRDRGADGVNLDFEPIVAGYSDEFTKLVRSVRTELNAIAPGYQLTFDTMGSIGNQPIAEATAPGGADAVFIMGYDYRTASASVAGSISPLTGPVYDLTDTVKAYTAKIPPSKVILGIPYYGRAWSTPTDALHAKNISGAKYGGSAEPSYAQAADLVAAYGRRWDSVEQAPWTAYRRETCTAAYGCVTSWRQLYYDDAASLKLRYDLVNRTSLRGAGIWALGFDNGRPELRAALADKFLADRTPPVTGVSTFPQQQRDEGFRVAWVSYDDSTVRGYDVQVSTDGGAWAAWLTATTLTSWIFLGADGHTYAFRVRATDVHGNVSAWNSAIALGALGVPGAITVGGFATVVTDGLRMRSSPTTGASIMTTLADGEALRVIGGPVSAEGYLWFQVAGPVRQWGPVDSMNIGGWVAASGNGVTNAAPRSPVYATRVNAGITGLTLAGGGMRALTPNGDGLQDTLRISWTNERTFDSLALRIHRRDGSLAGTVPLAKTAAGAHAYQWDGRIDGVPVPAGTYVVQLRGVDGSASFHAPSVNPVSSAQVARFGLIVGPAAPTSVVSFRSSPASPTAASKVSYGLTFGGPVSSLSSADFSRSGTATGCVLGAPSGSGATWTIPLARCSAGTVGLSLKPRAVVDAVSNWGPTTQVNAPTLVIDRAAPRTSGPRVGLRSGVSLASTAPAADLPAVVTWSASDAGGAGVLAYDVARSIDGGSFRRLSRGLTSASLAVALRPGHAYRFEVRARDRAGNVGGWVAGPTLRAYLPQQTTAAIAYKGTWTKEPNPSFSDGTARYSISAGASAAYTFTGRAIGWVTTPGPTRGSARIYVDGVHVATIDTHAPTTAYRRVAFSRTWSQGGTHTIKIVAAGTSGHPRVDLDAFEVLR